MLPGAFIHMKSGKHAFQLFILFMGNERILIRSRKVNDIGPSSVRRDIVDHIEVDDIRLMASEENLRVKPCFHIAQRFARFKPASAVA